MHRTKSSDPSLQTEAEHCFEVRQITTEDVPALKALIDATELFPSEMLDEMMFEFLNGKGAAKEFWLTADFGGSPSAIAYCAPEKMTNGTWNLLLIAVHPSRQGNGCGTALMSHVEERLRAHGQRLLLVETSALPEYERARAFYLKQGFEEEARIRGYYEAGEDKLVFRKAL